MKCESCGEEYGSPNGHQGTCNKCHTKAAVHLGLLGPEIQRARAAGMYWREFREKGALTKEEEHVVNLAGKIADDIETLYDFRKQDGTTEAQLDIAEKIADDIESLYKFRAGMPEIWSE